MIVKDLVPSRHMAEEELVHERDMIITDLVQVHLMNMTKRETDMIVRNLFLLMNITNEE